MPSPLTHTERERMRELFSGAVRHNGSMTLASELGGKGLRALAALDARNELLREVLESHTTADGDFKDEAFMDRELYDRIRAVLEGSE